MAMLPRNFRHFNRIFDDMWRDLARFEGDAFFMRSTWNYWRYADPTSFESGQAVGKMVNNDKQFKLQIDVSHFKPENLKVNLDGRKLTIEGEHEESGERGFSKRTFSHTLVLPEDVDVPQIKSLLSDDGHLSIEAPKAGASKDAKQIPIERAPTQGQAQVTNGEGKTSV